MREIEFRGHFQNKWVYGYLIIDEGGNHWIRSKQGNMYLVDPDSVGQYTGLKDKKIYEGDIIKADRMFNDVVVFEDGGFNLKGGDSGLNLLYQLENYGNYEIIGNKYENPELLEGKQM